jgi:hypothetical protein
MQAHEVLINKRRETICGGRSISNFDENVKKIKELCLDTPGYRYIFFYYFTTGQRGVIALRNLKQRLIELKPYLKKLPKGIDNYKRFPVLKHDLDIIEKDVAYQKFLRLCPREIRMIIQTYERSIPPSIMKYLHKKDISFFSYSERKQIRPFYAPN